MQSLTLSLLAASAAAWKVDLRNNYEGSHTVFLKAGETLEVLTDGQAGTGYSWVNNIDHSVRTENVRPGHIDFLDWKRYEDDLNDYADEDERVSFMGRNSSFEHDFTTEAGLDFEETIHFTFARPWMLREFPMSANEANSNSYAEVNVVAKANFAHDFTSNSFDLENLPNDLPVN